MARMTTLMTRGVLVAILGLATLGSTIVMPERAEAASSSPLPGPPLGEAEALCALAVSGAGEMCSRA